MEISILLIFILGFYLLMFILMFTFRLYQKEKRKIREFDTRRYTYEYCILQMKSIREFYIDLNKTKEKKDRALLILSIFEEIAVGVYSGVLCEEVVKLYCGNYMQNLYNPYMIFEIRKEFKDAGLYANYEKFMEEWHIKSKNIEIVRGR